jgi:hypothetical protein
MTDQQQRIVVGPSDSVPEVLRVLRRAANTDVVLEIPATSPLFLTANEFRALQAIADHDQIRLVVTSDDPLRQQLALLFKITIAPPEPTTAASEPEGELPFIGPPVPTEPEPVADVEATEPQDVGEAVDTTDVLPADDVEALPAGSGRFGSFAARARATSTRQRLIVAAAIVVVLLVAFLAAYQFLPRATVTLVVKRQPIDQTLSVAILAPGAPTPESGISIVANPVTFPVSASRSAPATGVKTIGDVAARGTVTLSNPTGQPVTIEAGTRFEDRISGTVYQFVATVQVGAGEGDAPGFGQAEVVCVEPGAVGNREVGFLSGMLENGVYYANREAAIAGGTDKQSTVVTDADLKSLQTAALNDLVALASTQSPGTGLVILTPSIEIKEPVLTPDVQVGQEATTITLQASGQASALAYNADDLTTAARNALSGVVPEGYEIDPAATQLSNPTLSESDGDESVMTIRATGSAVAALSDERRQQIAEGVAGKSEAEARAFLASQPEVENVSIDYSPGWLPARIPSNAGRVTIETR